MPPFLLLMASQGHCVVLRLSQETLMQHCNTACAILSGANTAEYLGSVALVNDGDASDVPTCWLVTTPISDSAVLFCHCGELRGQKWAFPVNFTFTVYMDLIL